ncbi:hypothetical protein GUJ93_ZPchr0003g18576 [Zizania palustris]|uniref:Uncharacterized protein n=1 Tax=Zizania palustris TaxID=103762 RepID=A0A8J5VCT6_ZIZPA|nr:hypothetical protein GUJ93_ZPchr0003g18576 [Zizania palustris]
MEIEALISSVCSNLLDGDQRSFGPNRLGAGFAAAACAWVELELKPKSKAFDATFFGISVELRSEGCSA